MKMWVTLSTVEHKVPESKGTQKSIKKNDSFGTKFILLTMIIETPEHQNFAFLMSVLFLRTDIRIVCFFLKPKSTLLTKLFVQFLWDVTFDDWFESREKLSWLPLMFLQIMFIC